MTESIGQYFLLDETVVSSKIRSTLQFKRTRQYLPSHNPVLE